MNQLKTLSWFVFRYDINTNCIEQYDVFIHRKFTEEVMQALQQQHEYDVFSEKMKSIAMYYFWCKCEYEIVITSFPSYVNADEIDRIIKYKNRKRFDISLDCAEKIDIFQQLMMNWKQFVCYVWSFKH